MQSQLSKLTAGLAALALIPMIGARAASDTRMRDAAATAGTSILELRQYKIVSGKRDQFVDLFERDFVESQEADGMLVLGQFRDLDDQNRFVWLRQFPSMPSREKSLTAFYFGPVWKAHRDEANPMLDDNDNVLLLHPATTGLGLVLQDRPRIKVGEKPRKAHLVIATIHYLWKDPSEGFTEFFSNKLQPLLEGAGMQVLGGYVREKAPNNFPRLPVREGEKIFVSFTRFSDQAAYDRAEKALQANPIWRNEVGVELAAYEERRPQVLRLAPTPRSALR